MKRLSIICILFLLSVLISCGDDGGSDRLILLNGGGNSAPVADAGDDQTVHPGKIVALNGSSSTDPDGTIASYNWTETSGTVEISDPSLENPSITAPIIAGDSEAFTFELTVTDDDGLTSTDTCTITVSNFVDITEGNAVHDALYTAYAGIGYMNAENPDDNEILYNVMFDDLNSLIGELFYQILDSFIAEAYGSELLGLLINLISSGPVIIYDAVGVHVEIQIPIITFNPLDLLSTGTIPWQFIMKIKFYPEGTYLHNTAYYSGSSEPDVVDLKATISGAITFSGNADEMIISCNVNILTHESLKAAYNGFNVHYNDWNITYSCDINNDGDVINFHIMPIPEMLSSQGNVPDNRNYNLSGNFDINNGSYIFDGVNYLQEQPTVTDNPVVSVNGTISTPGMGGTVSVSCDPGISRDTDGYWLDNKLTLSSGSLNVDVNFNDDGSAVINPGQADEDIVSSWQDTLDPLTP